MAIKVPVPAELGKPLGMYSDGVVAPAGERVAGEAVGQVGMDASARLAGADVVARTKQALDNVRPVLGAAGCGMRDVVRFQTLLTGAEYIEGFMQACRARRRR